MTSLSAVLGVRRSDSCRSNKPWSTLCLSTIVALCRRTLREFTDFSHSLAGWNTSYRVGRHTRSRQTSKRRNEIVYFKVNRTRIALSFLPFTR